MAFIQIVEPDQTFPYTPLDESGRKLESQFELRLLTEDELTQLRKRHNSYVWKNRQRLEEFDRFGFAADVVDKAIVSWSRVRRAGTDEDLPCERKYKLLLPERLQVEILRLCAGKEAGELFQEEDGEAAASDPKASSPTT